MILAAVPVLAEGASTSATVISVLSGLIAALIAVAGGVGTWAALHVARNSQLIANYQSTASSWESVAGGLKAEKEALEGQVLELSATISTLQAKNAALQEIATGNPQLERMAESMGRSFKSLRDQMTRIEQQLQGAESA
jgi:peptidoglycan hydrolase CwlO-like protein